MKTRSSPSRHFRGKLAGFTLAEVLVGSSLFAVVAMAVTMTLMQSFKVIALARYEERAGNVLKVLSDQFQTSVLNDTNPEDAANPRKTFFRPTATGATGVGMGWNKALQTFVYPSAKSMVAEADYIEGTSAGLKFPLNTTGENEHEAPIATVTRRIRYVNPATGAPYSDGTTPAQPAAGYLVQADFSLSFTVLGQTRTLTAKVLRNYNPTDK